MKKITPMSHFNFLEKIAEGFVIEACEEMRGLQPPSNAHAAHPLALWCPRRPTQVNACVGKSSDGVTHSSRHKRHRCTTGLLRRRRLRLDGRHDLSATAAPLDDLAGGRTL